MKTIANRIALNKVICGATFMTFRAWTAPIAIGVAVTITGLAWNRDTTEWLDKTPDRFVGNWILVEDLYNGGKGIRSITLTPSGVQLRNAVDQGELEVTDSFPVNRVSVTSTPSSDRGVIIIFYGRLSPATNVERRLEMRFGSKQPIFVQEIFSTGYGVDRWFDVGEFVKSD